MESEPKFRGSSDQSWTDVLASIDTKIAEVKRDFERASSEAEREQAFAKKRELLAYVAGVKQAACNTRDEIDERKAEMVRRNPLLRSRRTRRRVFRGRSVILLRRPPRRGRSSHVAQPGHRRSGASSSTASSDPGDDGGPEPGPSPAAFLERVRR